MIMRFRTVEYDSKKNHLIILDQTKLPESETYKCLKTVNDVAESIRKLEVRGAPLIGVVAAYGVVMAAFNGNKQNVRSAIRLMRKARPTGVNLTWALDRMAKCIAAGDGLFHTLLNEARGIENEDRKACLAIGRLGAALIRSGAKIMTHCNAGALATAGIGTALAIMYTARQQRKNIKVYACETRPLLQGGRLTAWELTRNHIETHVICDNMAAHFMPGMSSVFVGADRIALNGDTANKIGTKGLAIIAHAHRVPLYVAAPSSSFDPEITHGSSIPIEHRNQNEIAFFNNRRIASRRAIIDNPSFDVTPACLISAIITEHGIIRPPFKRNIARILKKSRFS